MPYFVGNESSNHQSVPMWTGFNASLEKKSTTLTVTPYMPTIEAPLAGMAIIYKTMRKGKIWPSMQVSTTQYMTNVPGTRTSILSSKDIRSGCIVCKNSTISTSIPEFLLYFMNPSSLASGSIVCFVGEGMLLI